MSRQNKSISLNSSYQSKQIMSAKYPKCNYKKDHAGQPLNLICLNSNCIQKNNIICSLCKASQHSKHQVIPLKMLLNKSDDLLKKKYQSQEKKEDQNNQREVQSFLIKIEQFHNQNMYLLKHFVQQISKKIQQCQEILISHYVNVKKLIEKQINKQTQFERALQESTRPFDDFSQMKLSINTLLSYIKITKNQFSLQTNLMQKIKSYQSLTNNFKSNIENITDDTESLLSQIFSQKSNTRPSTAITQKTNIGKSDSKYTFSTVNKPKSIQLSSQNKSAKQTDINIGKIIFVNENMGVKKQSIKFKINSVSASIGFGVGLCDFVKDKKYKFSTNNHGLFMNGSNSYLYSHTNAKQNMVVKGISMKNGDEIQVQLVQNEIRFKKKGDIKVATLSLKQLKQDLMSQLCFCVCLNSNNDKVTII